MRPDGIILSPGPRAPKDAGICVDLLTKLPAHIPVLGVCLGHQAIAEAFGGRVIHACEPMHGRASAITHDEQSALFAGVPSPFDGARYHSLMIDLPNHDTIKVTAQSGQTIMAIEHTSRPIYGIQFHPESLLTPYGQTLMNNFKTIIDEAKHDKLSVA